MITILIYIFVGVNRVAMATERGSRDMKNQRHVAGYRRDSSGHALGLSFTALLHIALVYALLQHHSMSLAITAPQPLMVTFLAPAETPKLVEPPVAKPKPVVQHRAVRERRVPQPIKPAPIVAPGTEPASVQTPAPAHADPAPSVATPAASQATAVASAAPAPQMTQPIFNADYLRNPAPRYPPLARRTRQEGKVVLGVLVDTGGGASQIEVRNSSGSEVLDEAALDAVKRWRFVPARRGDQPVAAWVLIPINFTLQG